MMILGVIFLLVGSAGYIFCLSIAQEAVEAQKKQIALLKLELEKKQAELHSWVRYCKELEAQVIDLNQQLKLKETNNA